MKEDKTCCGTDAKESSCETSCCGSSSATNIEEAVKESYGKRWASLKATKAAQSESQASMRSAHEALLEELRPFEGMTVLDIGSGSGETVLAIAEKVGSTGKSVGIDFSPDGIKLARENAKKRGLEKIAEFHQAHAVELPFPDNTFDAVISECVVCLIQDKQKVLNEKARVLRSGGRVIMHDVITWAPMPRAMREDKGLYCGCVGGAVSLDEYVEMIKKAGLTDIKTVDFTRGAKRMLSLDSVAKILKKTEAKSAREIVDFVNKGGIGYALLVGTKK
jgi:SAM-dependent methyltransferase